MRLNRVQRRDQPLRCAGARFRALGQKRFAACTGMEHDGPGFEQDESVLLEDWNLAKGLQRAIFERVSLARLKKAYPIGNAGLLKRPPHAQVANQASCKWRNPWKSGNRNHAECSS